MTRDELKNQYKNLRQHCLYNRWRHMRSACYAITYADYANVGGKGIKMDPRFQDFWMYALLIERKLGLPPHTDSKLARKDQTKDFVLNNLEWADHKTIGHRFVKTQRLTYKRQTLTIKQWAAKINIKPGTIQTRIELGWSIPEILNFEQRKRPYTQRTRQA